MNILDLEAYFVHDIDREGNISQFSGFVNHEKLFISPPPRDFARVGRTNAKWQTVPPQKNAVLKNGSVRGTDREKALLTWYQ